MHYPPEYYYPPRVFVIWTRNPDDEDDNRRTTEYLIQNHCTDQPTCADQNSQSSRCRQLWNSMTKSPTSLPHYVSPGSRWIIRSFHGEDIERWGCGVSTPSLLTLFNCTVRDLPRHLDSGTLDIPWRDHSASTNEGEPVEWVPHPRGRYLYGRKFLFPDPKGRWNVVLFVWSNCEGWLKKAEPKSLVSFQTAHW